LIVESGLHKSSLCNSPGILWWNPSTQPGGSIHALSSAIHNIRAASGAQKFAQSTIGRDAELIFSSGRVQGVISRPRRSGNRV